MKRITEVISGLGLLVLLCMGCPPKPGTGDFQTSKLLPQEFDYQGVRVVHYATEREPIELRWVFRHADDAARTLLLETSLGNIRPLTGRQVFLRHRPGHATFQITTLSQHFDASIADPLQLLGLAQPNEQRIEALLKQQDLLKRSREKLGTPQMTPAIYREWQRLPVNLDFPLPAQLNISPDSLQSVWDEIRNPGNWSLVIVGNVDYETIVDALLEPLGNLGSAAAKSSVPAPSLEKGQVKVEEFTSENGYGEFVLALHFSEGDALERAGLELLKEALQVHLNARFAELPDVRYALEWSFLEAPENALLIRYAGYRGLPFAELLISELRQVREKEWSEEEVLPLRKAVLNRKLALWQSNATLANHLATRVALDQLPDLAPELEALQQVDARRLNQLLTRNWEAVSWFFLAEGKKIDSQTLLRF